MLGTRGVAEGTMPWVTPGITNATQRAPTWFPDPLLGARACCRERTKSANLQQKPVPAPCPELLLFLAIIQPHPVEVSLFPPPGIRIEQPQTRPRYPGEGFCLPNPSRISLPNTSSLLQLLGSLGMPCWTPGLLPSPQRPFRGRINQR